MADLTARQIIAAALRKLGVVSRGKTINAADEADGLESLKILLREWSSQHLMVFKETQDSHALTAGTASYTIGSGATIITTRPVVIKGAYVRTGGIDVPLRIVDPEYYRNIAQKTIGDSTPAVLYYSPGYSQGTIYLWPPGGGTLYIDSLKPLTEPSALTSDVVFPGEYQAALIWNLAMEMASEYGVTVSPLLAARAVETKDHIIVNNAALSIQQVALDYIDDQGSSYDIDAG